MAKKHNLICIGCPLGCRLNVMESESGGWLVEGYLCQRGEAYAIKEVTSPTRVLTTTVRMKDGFLRRLPVRTKEAIPKNLIFEAMEILNHVVVEAPIRMGDVIVEDIFGTGVDVIASRSMKRIS